MLVVATAEHEAYVVEGLLSHQGQSFRCHLKHGVSFKLTYAHVVLGEQIVLSLVLAELKHGCILEFHNTIYSFKHLRFNQLFGRLGT